MGVAELLKPEELARHLSKDAFAVPFNTRSAEIG